MNRTPSAVLVLVAEVLTASYIALIAWLMSGWMVDDSDAFRMQGIDWIFAGCLRFMIWSTLAALFAMVARKAHRRWVVADPSPSWFQGLPVLLGGGIALASAIGAARFIVERPFM